MYSFKKQNKQYLFEIHRVDEGVIIPPCLYTKVLLEGVLQTSHHTYSFSGSKFYIIGTLEGKNLQFLSMYLSGFFIVTLQNLFKGYWYMIKYNKQYYQLIT